MAKAGNSLWTLSKSRNSTGGGAVIILKSTIITNTNALQQQQPPSAPCARAHKQIGGLRPETLRAAARPQRKDRYSFNRTRNLKKPHRRAPTPRTSAPAGVTSPRPPPPRPRRPRARRRPPPGSARPSRPAAAARAPAREGARDAKTAADGTHTDAAQ